MKPRLLPVTAVFLLAPLGLTAQSSDGFDVAEELRGRVERLRADGMLRIGDEIVWSSDLLLALYEGRAYEPLWRRSDVESLRRAVSEAAMDGLYPEDYRLSALARAAGATDPVGVAERDLLSTDALIALAHDLRYGRTMPQGPADARVGWPAGDPGAARELAELVSSGRVRSALDELRPDHFAYTGLVRALARLRWIEIFGGWPEIDGGGTLRPDSVDDRVPALRARLALEGDLVGPADGTSRLYDRDLEAAVRSFQRRHGLAEDGLVGGSTLAALNVPVEERIRQIRVNLDRVRWVAHTLPDTFVSVSIPAARVQLIRGSAVAFETRAIVGRRDDPTPAFAAEMRWVDLNPTWTVPPGIVGEVLALQRADSSYLRRLGMRLLDAAGEEVDPSTVDLSMEAADFPYVIRQDPGPLNALGRIKLMLPNQYHVYLHDTPERALFARETRLFSHGCVRIEDPVGLAELVLGDPRRWNRETLGAAIAEGATRTLVLARPVPVFVLYWTAAADPNGTVRFLQDVYGRDAAVLASLDSGPESGTPVGPPR